MNCCFAGGDQWNLKAKQNIVRNAVAREDVADSNSPEQILGCPLRESNQKFRAERVLDF